jgi:hypothetical protein
VREMQNCHYIMLPSELLTSIAPTSGSAPAAASSSPDMFTGTAKGKRRTRMRGGEAQDKASQVLSPEPPHQLH